MIFFSPRVSSSTKAQSENAALHPPNEYDEIPKPETEFRGPEPSSKWTVVQSLSLPFWYLTYVFNSDLFNYVTFCSSRKLEKGSWMWFRSGHFGTGINATRLVNVHAPNSHSGWPIRPESKHAEQEHMVTGNLFCDSAKTAAYYLTE